MMLLLVLLACHADPDADTGVASPRCTARGPLDDRLTLADVQAIGSHNSYHVQTEPLFDASFAFTQPPLADQAEMGVRSFELDVHRADDGTMEVFHLPALDAGTTCATLVDCLGQLRTWSDAHPCHSPLTVWLEPKDDIDADAVGYTTLEDHMLDLDAPVREAWPDRLLTPDLLRGDAPDLPTAAAGGWPFLSDVRGMLLATVLDVGDRGAEYLEGALNLEGRALFAKSDAVTDPWAAMFKVNNGYQVPDEVAALVAGNFLVTSTADEILNDEATNASILAATLVAGPHYLASDHVVPQGDSDWVIALDGGSPRCHPARVPEGCGPADIEP